MVILPYEKKERRKTPTPYEKVRVLILCIYFSRSSLGADWTHGLSIVAIEAATAHIS